MNGQYEGECSTRVWPIAVYGEAAAELSGGKGSAMQAVTMAGFAGSKTVLKYTGQVFLGNPDAGIGDLEENVFRIGSFDLQGNILLTHDFAAGMFCIVKSG